MTVDHHEYDADHDHRRRRLLDTVVQEAAKAFGQAIGNAIGVILVLELIGKVGAGSSSWGDPGASGAGS